MFKTLFLVASLLAATDACICGQQCRMASGSVGQCGADGQTCALWFVAPQCDVDVPDSYGASYYYGSYGSYYYGGYGSYYYGGYASYYYGSYYYDYYYFYYYYSYYYDTDSLEQCVDVMCQGSTCAYWISKDVDVTALKNRNSNEDCASCQTCTACSWWNCDGKPDILD